MPRPLVLLSNDDGFRALGIRALRSALLGWAEVVLCAPESEQSASSHALSLHGPLRLRTHEEGIHAVDGTPADSVYVALNSGILPRKPDLVVSGMNHGLNLGLDVFYSGTVAAAREGALSGFPALAVSAARSTDIEAAAEQASRLARALLESQLPGPRLFNVNIPTGSQWELRATRLGQRHYGGGLVRRQDPRGQDYYWIGGSDSEVTHGEMPGSDTEAYDQGVIGVTPLLLDLWASQQADEAALLVGRALDKAIARPGRVD